MEKKPGPPALRDFFEDKTLALIYRLCHEAPKDTDHTSLIKADHCEKITTGVGRAAILLIRRHRGRCSLQLSGALHGLWKWIQSDFEEDEVIFSIQEHDDLKECADDTTNSNDDLIIDIRLELMFVAPKAEEFRELLELILIDLAETDRKYKKDVARQLVTEIVEYMPPEQSDTWVTYSSDNPRSGALTQKVKGESGEFEARDRRQTTALLDRTEKQQFVALMMRLVESTVPYITDEINDHNERVDAEFSDLFIESAATPLVRLSTIYERKVKILDARSYRMLLLKYREYIEQDFKSEIVIAKNEEIDRHSLNVSHSNIVSNSDLWSVVVEFCNLLKTEDLHIFQKASAMLLRILSEYTDDIHGIEAGKVSASLRRRTKRVSD
jgi:hypothetical protein